MEENDWKIGDVVQLKSGGPKMTVNRIWEDSEQSIQCEWFDDSKELRGARFSAETLKLASSTKNHSF